MHSSHAENEICCSVCMHSIISWKGWFTCIYTVARSRCSFEQNVNFNLFSTLLPPPRECCTLCCLSISMFKHERIWNLRQLDDAVFRVNVNFTCWNFLLHIHESSAFLFALLLLPPPRELYCEFFLHCFVYFFFYYLREIFHIPYEIFSKARKYFLIFSRLVEHKKSSNISRKRRWVWEICPRVVDLLLLQYNNLHFPSPRTRRTSNFFCSFAFNGCVVLPCGEKTTNRNTYNENSIHSREWVLLLFCKMLKVETNQPFAYIN